MTANRGIIKTVGIKPVVYDVKTVTENYTILATDNNTVLLFNSSSNLNCNIPVGFDFIDGYQVIIFQQGTGIVTITKDGGVSTLSANNEVQTRVRYSTVHIIKIAANTFIVGGDLA